MEPDTWIVDRELTVRRVSVSSVGCNKSCANLEEAIAYAAQRLGDKIANLRKEADDLESNGVRVRY